jgi:polar amino acid transport system substrate-binding protein
MKVVVFIVLAINLFALDIYTHSADKETYINNGILRGIPHKGKRALYVEIVNHITKQLYGKILPIKIVPFKRGLKLVTHKEDIVFFNVTRTPKREHLVKWVGPISKDIDYFYEIKRHHIKTLDDAKKVKKICILNGCVHQSLLKKLGFKNLYPANSYTQCIKLLKSNRVDLIISAKNSIKTKAKKAGVDYSLLHQTPVIVLKSYGYIAMSKNISDDIVKKWQEVFDNLIYKQLQNLYQKEK